MKKCILIVLVVLLSRIPSSAQVSQLGVRTSQFITLSFPEEIMDLSISSPDYSAQVKGRYLLLKAKSNRAPKSSLFIRYGRSRQGYMAEVSFVPQAPLMVSALIDQQDLPLSEEKIIFSTEQDYYDLGVQHHGLRMMVTHLIHQEGKTYVQIYIDNRRPIPCNLSSPTFEHLSRKKRLLFFPKYEGRMIEALESPGVLSLPARSGGYYLFVLPSSSSDGLRISLLEPDSDFSYKVTIPEKVLRRANSLKVQRRSLSGKVK